jgi:DNA adenine methylase
MTRLTGPLTWFGGKARLAKHILPLIPDSHCYVEPFGGAASVLCGLEPRKVEVYNDIDGQLVNLFRVLQSPRLANRLKRRLEYTPYARAEFARGLDAVDDTDPVTRAWGTFVTHNCGFGGKAERLSDWGTSKMESRVSVFVNRVARLEQWSERFRNVAIDNRPALKVLDSYDGPQTVFYCDPPYAPSTRKSGKYRCEMTTAEHCELVEQLLTLQGRVVLSGYDTPLYRPLTKAGWKIHRFQKVCTSIPAKSRTPENQHRTEVVWISPE